MEMNSPAWLNARYVQNVLRNFEKDESIEVSDITVKAATAKGDNYGSDMYRVNVNFSRGSDANAHSEKKCFIVKALPEGELREEMMESVGVFDTEMAMMSSTLPKMQEILKNVCPASLSAQCFFVQYEKPTHLVFEDLLLSGFRMADRRAGLDLDHCFIAIQNLGRFHAASIALKEKDSESITTHKKGMLHDDQPPTVTRFFDAGTKTLADEAVKWDELSPQIAEKLHKLSKCLYKKGCEAARYREDDFNVLNHGDFWVNNMLFRYDEQKKPIDHIFVDFQISNYGTPAIDILYFFGTSTSEDVRLHHRELLLREYHATLSDTMTKLKCSTEVPSFEKLQKCLSERAFLEVVANVTILPFVVLEKDEEINIDNLLLEQDSYVNPGYRGKTYRRIMTRVLPIYNDLGLLDV